MLPRQDVSLKDVLSPLMTRIRGEYREMPGMQLTVVQASRLWHLDARTCEAVLLSLVDEGFLIRTSGGAFVLARAE